MHRIPHPLFSLFAIAMVITLALTGCTGGAGGRVKEGTLEFDVSYPGMSSVPMGLPDKAVYKFRQMSSITEFSGMGGLVKITYMANGEKWNAQQSLCLVDKKYISDLTRDMINEVNAEFVKNAEPAEGTKEIAGFKCKKARITLVDGSTYDAWYTTELGNDSINWCNPYHQIRGVMMEFEMRKYNITMKLTAKNFIRDPVSDKDWQVGDDYKKVLLKDQNKILEDLAPH